MKWPRVRIFDLMGVITLAAINCLPYRMMAMPGKSTIADPSGSRPWDHPGGEPPLIPLAKMVRDIRRVAKLGRFISGFLVFGLAAWWGRAVLMSSEDSLRVFRVIWEGPRDLEAVPVVLPIVPAELFFG